VASDNDQLAWRQPSLVLLRGAQRAIGCVVFVAGRSTIDSSSALPLIPLTAAREDIDG
jgi:hypothetical protein